jgi:nucleoside-diphosphate-sugar epimerase
VTAARRVLVTGASGFIGRGTLSALRAKGFEVHAVSSRATGAEALEGVHWERADLLSETAAAELVGRLAPTDLLHLAWYAEPGAFWRSPENVRWVEASLRLLRAFAGAGGRRAVIAGSCAEYAWSSRVRCVERETPCRPATLYGASKHALYLIAERFAEEAGVSLAVGRVFFVFGPHEHPARLAGSVARALVQGEEAPCSHGEQVRDFLYSEDLSDAFVALLCSDVEGPVNLASGRPTRVRELVQALAEAAGRPELVRLGVRPAARGEPAELLADVTRLRDEVGWAPTATLEQRAAETIAWWRAALRGGAQPPRPE